MKILRSIATQGFVFAGFVGFAAGCENHHTTTDMPAGDMSMTSTGLPTATFTVTDGAPQLVSSIPWPSDLFRDATGHITVAYLPLVNSPNSAAILEDFSTNQDGFGVTSGAYFPVGNFIAQGTYGAAPDPDTGNVDATTLTGNVHLLPLSCPDGSITASTPELPVHTALRTSDSPQRIYARPAQGIVLHEQCTYAWVVTTGVKTDKGALGASADMQALLSSTAPGSRLAAAYTIYKPLRDRLASGALTTTDVAVATVFTTHSLTHEYVAARAIVEKTPAVANVKYIFAHTPTADDAGSLDTLFGVATTEQPGNDNPGGIAHGNIDYVVQGTFDTADFLGGTTLNALGVSGTVPGQVAHDTTGPTSKGTITVPFTLVIPTAATGADITKLRFATVTHGLGASRVDMITVANTLAGKGIASILIDLPFHGARAADAVDVLYNHPNTAGMDGFGEPVASPPFNFFDANGNTAASIAPANPAAIRGAFFQAVNDIEQAFRLGNGGDLSAVKAKDARLATLALDGTHEVYVGESFGSMIGTIVSAFEPGLEATVLDVDGGGTVIPLLVDSAVYGPLFSVLLNGSDGANGGNTSDPADTDFGFNLVGGLIDIGDSLAYSPYVVAKQTYTGGETDKPCHVLQLSAYQDESVPNQANLAVARAMGLTPLTLSDGVAPDLTGWPEAITPATGMLTANDNGQTAAFIQFRPASHVMMTTRNGQSLSDLSSGPPYPARATPVAIANPIDRINQIVGDFIDAASKGTVPVVQ